MLVPGPEAAIAGWIAARRLRLPLGFMFDITVIGIVLGEAIGRIGDIINGEHHAVSCGPPGLCVTYDNPDSLGQGAIPSCENFITSLSSIDTKPAGPMRFAWRRRLSVISSLSVA